MSRLGQFLVCLSILVIGSCANPPIGEEVESIPEPTSPANVLLALERLYEDTDIAAPDRARSLANLLAPPPGDSALPAFTFLYGICDIECPFRSWGYAEEVEAHETMFREVYRLDLDLNAGPDYEFTDIEHHGWRVIHSESVRIRVWLNEREFVEKRTGGQFFIFAPVADRWYLADWWEYRSEAMWGDFKSEFLPDGE